ncbi:MAG: alpha-mannosidase [Vicinamibacterales bacterium]
MRVAFVLAAITLLALAASGQEQPPRAKPAPENPVLYVVSNSHLDTQWNWTVQDTIRQFVPATFFDNFKLFERFPNYVFNFEGAVHYMWFKEYHPEAWDTLKKLVDSGRWQLAGSWVNAVDTNIPSPESLMRQALYGKRFYRQEFGKVSQDIYLPDCFGFGFALPSIGAHCGLKAFSTQKLSWGAALPAPFAVGLWKGADGSSLVASIRGGDYTSRLRSDISTDPKWNQDLVDIGGGRKVGFRYFGVGDVGGAPDAESVEWLEKAMSNAQAPVVVRNASADQLARDLGETARSTLPVYEGELLLKTHGVGCYTSQAALKAWNRQNELLADAAERASVVAEWVGGPAYPGERLRTAWVRFLWHQFHDDLTGTSIPQAYQFSWNDQLLSLNQFSSVLTGSVRAIASGLDTRPEEPSAGQHEGVPVVVFNPIAQRRTDPVEASVLWTAPLPAAVRVVDMGTGEEVPAQVLSRSADRVRVLFLASVPGVGFKVFDVQPSAAPARAAGLSVTAASLSNERYTVELDADGDIASVFDKQLRLELLGGPARLLMFDDYSPSWPAWEILWSSVSGPPRARVRGPAKVRIVERGPVRVALQVTRTSGGSTFVQTIRLARGGDCLEVETEVDWRTPGTLLKASFPLSASSPKATYDLGLGTIQRPNASENLYEVPAQQWADLTDAAGKYGVSVLNDSKYGWDKPSDNELRLTLIHTPTPKTGFVYQASNDLGRHRFTYALAPHAGDWREGEVPSRASRLNQPLLAFQTDPHPGPFGRQLAMVQLDGPPRNQVAVRAIKKAEDSDEIVVRVQETHGKPAGAVRLAFASPVLEAREVNATEEPVGAAKVEGGRLVFDLGPYQPRSFALRTAPPQARVADVGSFPVDLAFDLDGISTDESRGDGDFDGSGRTLPAEVLPERIDINGILFELGSTAPGNPNVLTARGQRVEVPVGPFNRVYLLASAVGGNVEATLAFEGAAKRSVAQMRVREWTGAIGQWSSRLADERLLREPFVPPMKGQSWTQEAIAEQMTVRWMPPPGQQTGSLSAGAEAGGRGGASAKQETEHKPARAATVVGIEKVRPGWVERDEVAWVATHLHDRSANLPYIFGYLFKYGFDLPKGTIALVLPDDPRIRVFAVTAANEPSAATRPAAVLYAPELPPPPPPPRRKRPD